MTTPTTWTVADVAALESAIKFGEKRVRYGDKEVEYGSPAEMLKLLAVMRGQVDAATASPAIYAGRID